MGDLYNLADLTNKVGRDRWARRGRPSGPSLPAVSITKLTHHFLPSVGETILIKAKPARKPGRLAAMI
jgi:hypothetical protein